MSIISSFSYKQAELLYLLFLDMLTSMDVSQGAHKKASEDLFGQYLIRLTQ